MRRNLPRAASLHAQEVAINQSFAGACDLTHVEMVSTPMMAIGLALCGRVLPEQVWTNEMSKRIPIGTVWKDIYLPAIKATEALHSADPARALDALHPAPAYERVYPYVPYLRGMALLRQRKGAEAAVDFGKVVNNPGVHWIVLASNCPQLYSLSRLGLARAQAMSGDEANARNSYKDLLEYWKDADSDYKPAIEARREYQALQKH